MFICFIDFFIKKIKNLSISSSYKWGNKSFFSVICRFFSPLLRFKTYGAPYAFLSSSFLCQSWKSTFFVGQFIFFFCSDRLSPAEQCKICRCASVSLLCSYDRIWYNAQPYSQWNLNSGCTWGGGREKWGRREEGGGRMRWKKSK